MRHRMQEISPFLAMEIMERAFTLEKEGKEIIHLEIGEPDFDTPGLIKEAAKEAMDRGRTNYTHSLGIYSLRECVAEHYFDRYGVTLSPENVIITNGTSPALLLALSALIEPGDEVILTNPCYACYPNFVKFSGGVPRWINVYDRDNYVLDIENVKKILGRKTKAILLNSPGNPTGTLLEKEAMKMIAELGITIISDEVYHGLVYEGKEDTFLNFSDNSFVLNGFSKAYAMTGWRLGYLIAPGQFVRDIQKLQQNLFISPNAFVQYGGIAALKEGKTHLEKMRNVFDERRLAMLQEIKASGFVVRSEPKGAFYVLADGSHFSKDSFSFAFEILEEAGVGVTPGIDFGTNGEGFIRFSYANSLENIEKAFEKIRAFLGRKYGDVLKGGV